MEVSQSINKWASRDDLFEDELEKNEFMAAANEVHEEYKEKYAK